MIFIGEVPIGTRAIERHEPVAQGLRSVRLIGHQLTRSIETEYQPA